MQRMQTALSINSITAGIHRITRVMRENGWLHERKLRPLGLTKATTEIHEKENMIRLNFHADAPFMKLLTDISHIACKDGKLYISPIMDCVNGEILSLIMSDNMKKELCIDTLKAACMRYPVTGAILHSDRRSQYTSYDNARMESFFATLKNELLYRIPTYRMTREEVKRIIFSYVFTYCSQKRIYTSNPDSLPPAAYRRLFEEDIQCAA